MSFTGSISLPGRKLADIFGWNLANVYNIERPLTAEEKLQEKLIAAEKIQNPREREMALISAMCSKDQPAHVQTEGKKRRLEYERQFCKEEGTWDQMYAEASRDLGTKGWHVDAVIAVPYVLGQAGNGVCDAAEWTYKQIKFW